MQKKLLIMYDNCWSYYERQLIIRYDHWSCYNTLLIIRYDHWSCYDQLLIIRYDHWSLPWSTVDHTLWSLIIAMKRLLIIHDVLHYHVTMKVIVTTIKGGYQRCHYSYYSISVSLLGARLMPSSITNHSTICIPSGSILPDISCQVPVYYLNADFDYWNMLDWNRPDIDCLHSLQIYRV